MYCDYCRRYITKSPREIKRNKHHFCDRECYYKFRRAGQGTQVKFKDMSAQTKIKTLAVNYHRMNSVA